MVRGISNYGGDGSSYGGGGSQYMTQVSPLSASSSFSSFDSLCQSSSNRGSIGDVFFGTDDIKDTRDLVYKEDVLESYRKETATKSLRRRSKKKSISNFGCVEFLKFLLRYCCRCTVGKLMSDSAADPSSLVLVAVANAFALSSSVYIAANVSGGHVNPAVTFGLVVGGRVNVSTALFYWISQMLASVMACLVLKVTTVSQDVPIYTIANEMTGFGASMLEGVLVFGLVYAVYTSGDPRSGALRSIGPLVVGLMAGAMVLAAGPFSGGSLNPALAFGSAVIAGRFKNQAVYWVGPLIGAAVAGLLYDNVVFPAHASVVAARVDSDGTTGV